MVEPIQFTQDSDTEADIQEVVAENANVPLVPYRLTEQAVENFLKVYSGKDDTGKSYDVEKLFAQTLAKRVGGKNSNYLNLYDDLISGSLTGTEFNDREIIQLLARDKDGNKLEKGTILKGFKREILPSTLSLGGFYAGAKAGSAITSPIPPVNPLFIGTKLAVPTIFGFAGALGAYEAGEEASDYLFGEEMLLTPGTKKYYEAGKTSASMLGWLPAPFLISNKVNFGGAQYIDNLLKSDAVKRIGPPTAEELTQSGVKKARGVLKYRPSFSFPFIKSKVTKPKVSRTARFAKTLETFLNRTGTESRKFAPSVIAGESIATAGTSFGAGVAEDQAPGQIGRRITFETLGGLTPSTVSSIAFKRLPELKRVLQSQLSKFKQGGVKEGLNIIKTSRQANAAQDILEKIRLLGEDEKEIIRLLKADETLPEVYKALGDDFKLENLLEGKSTAAMKTGSPALMAIEAHYAAGSGGTALTEARKKANQSYSNHFRNIYNVLVSTGDKESLQQAAEMAEEVFTLGINNRLINATDEVIKAFERVKGLSPEKNMELSQKLHDVAKAQMDLARTQEKTLWNTVGDIELDFDPNETINFIEDWDNVMPDEEIAKEQFNKLLPGLNAYVEKVKKGVFDPSPSRTEQAFSNLYERSRGTPARRVYDNIVTGRNTAGVTIDLENPTGEAIEILQTEANRLRNQRGASSKEASKLLRLKAEEMSESLATPTALDDGDNTITVRKLQDMRSLAISHGRRALAQGDDNTARIAYTFADSILKDLEAKMPEGMNNAYDLARAYSRSLNNTFTRAFAGDILSVQKTGAERLAPELLASRLLQGGDDPTLLRIQELRGILEFANDAMDKAVEAGVRSEFTTESIAKTAITLNSTIDKILRNARVASMKTEIDPKTGEVTEGLIDPVKLRDWINSNEELLNLEVFSNLKEDLSNSVTANQLLKQTKVQKAEELKERKDEINFQNLLPKNSGSPDYVAGRAINSPTPIRSLDNITKNIKTIENAEEQKSALSGYRSAILNYVMTKGGKTSDTFSPKAVYQEMFLPMKNVVERRGDRGPVLSLAQYMVSRNIMTDPHKNALEKTLKELIKIETADAAGDLGNLTKQASAMIDFYLRITGSALGTRAQKLIPGGGGSGELVAAGAGSKAMRQIFQDMPRLARDDVIAEMMENPKLLAEMLALPQNERDKLRIANTIKSFFTDLGFTPIRREIPSVIRETGDEINEELTVEQPVAKPQPAIPPVSDASPAMNAVRPAPLTVAQATPPAQADPQTRQRYAALFPNDPTSAMIRGSQGGIGSLFG
jgi:hypothetical protein